MFTRKNAGALFVAMTCLLPVASSTAAAGQRPDNVQRHDDDQRHDRNKDSSVQPGRACSTSLTR